MALNLVHVFSAAHELLGTFQKEGEHAVEELKAFLSRYDNAAYLKQETRYYAEHLVVPAVETAVADQAPELTPVVNAVVNAVDPATVQSVPVSTAPVVNSLSNGGTN